MNLNKYRTLTSQYDKFIYESYQIEELEDQLMLNFQYKITSDTAQHHVFNHRISYQLKGDDKELRLNRLKDMDALIFTIGMVESINYYKTICPRTFHLHCGRLTDEQKLWWQKLFYHGLGEFIYLNGLKEEVTEKDFVRFVDDETLPYDFDLLDIETAGNLIPVGGGKDSVVTLELLKAEHDLNTCFVMSPPQAALDCIEVAGYDHYLLANRYFDKHMIQMNKEGYLNGHVPFSAILGFIALLGAALLGKRYIPLSNERSANESTVIGESFNHQYSKSYEFEADFNQYVHDYLVEDIQYFSLLRPMYEIEIAEMFAKHRLYHDVFRSCNRGKKDNRWCGVCSKCLFVNIILSPYMTDEALVQIFGRHMLEDEGLEEIFLELIGVRAVKPFECVGTIDEVRWSMKTIILRQQRLEEPLPYLCQVFMQHVDLTSVNALIEDDTDHMIPEVYRDRVKRR